MIDVASMYIAERRLSRDYATALSRVSRSMAAAGVTPLTIKDSVFNRWLAALPQGATTRSNYARMGLSLWRYAVDCELAEHSPRRVIRVKPRNKPAVAWTLGELAMLLNAARSLTGVFKRSRCPKAAFYEAFVLAGYETGLRFSDVMALRCEQLRGDRLFVIANKTGVAVPKRLTPTCVQALRQLAGLGDGQSFFRWAACNRRARAHFSIVCSQAGLAGTPKWLRRTGATHVEIHQPGAATKFLGHLSPGLARRFYIDLTQLSAECPTPPAIPTGNSWQGQCSASGL